MRKAVTWFYVLLALATVPIFVIMLDGTGPETLMSLPGVSLP